MDYKTYSQYIKFAMDEEVERMREYLYSLEKEEDCSDDKYWTVEPSNFTLPSREELIQAFQGRIYSVDMAIISSQDEQAKEDLYLILRDLINS